MSFPPNFTWFLVAPDSVRAPRPVRQPAPTAGASKYLLYSPRVNWWGWEWGAFLSICGRSRVILWRPRADGDVWRAEIRAQSSVGLLSDVTANRFHLSELLIYHLPWHLKHGPACACARARWCNIIFSCGYFIVILKASSWIWFHLFCF